jgi:hypothetical protein
MWTASRKKLLAWDQLSQFSNGYAHVTAFYLKPQMNFRKPGTLLVTLIDHHPPIAADLGPICRQTVTLSAQMGFGAFSTNL